jgi:hypothetical protein
MESEMTARSRFPPRYAFCATGDQRESFSAAPAPTAAMPALERDRRASMQFLAEKTEPVLS